MSKTTHEIKKISDNIKNLSKIWYDENDLSKIIKYLCKEEIYFTLNDRKKKFLYSIDKIRCKKCNNGFICIYDKNKKCDYCDQIYENNDDLEKIKFF